jgi:hypothetical protein
MTDWLNQQQDAQDMLRSIASQLSRFAFIHYEAGNEKLGSQLEDLSKDVTEAHDLTKGATSNHLIRESDAAKKGVGDILGMLLGMAER